MSDVLPEVAQAEPSKARAPVDVAPTMIPLSKPYFDEREVRAAARAIRSGKVGGGGPIGGGLEQEMAERFAVRHVLLTTSCTSAMEAALMACGVGVGDEVICPSFTFTTTATSIVRQGARPVFVDIEPDTYNIDPREIAKAITPQTKAIMPVHYAGHACDMDAIMALAQEHGLFVIEDAAHAIGAGYNGQPLGTVGHIGCFSFHETKNLVCGEGGALLTNDDELAAKLETIREKGTNRAAFLRGDVDKYTWVSAGSSYVLSDILAAIALEQFHKLDEITAARTAIAERYGEALRGVEGIVLPVVKPYAEPNWHIFAIRVPDGTRDEFIATLRGEGIGAAFHYVPLHSSPYGRKVGRQLGNLAVTDLVARTLVRLPLYAGMATIEMRRVLEAVHAAHPVEATIA